MAQSRNGVTTSGLDADGDNAREYRFPDFLCIGAQKAGTTWLDKNMRRHPRLWLPPIKELQYFNDVHVPRSRRWTADHRRHRGKQVLQAYMAKTEAAEWNYRYIARLADIIDGPISDDWYGRIFALAKPDQICGEFAPEYCVLPEDGIRHILKLAPAVRIILSLRDPIERSWSHMRMLMKRRNICDISQIEQLARNADVLKRAHYPTIIANWRSQIPSARFLIITLDDIVSKPNLVLENTCAFLGAAFDGELFDMADKPVHVGEANEIPPGVYGILREKLRPTYDAFAELYPEVGSTWLLRHF